MTRGRGGPRQRTGRPKPGARVLWIALGVCVGAALVVVFRPGGREERAASVPLPVSSSAATDATPRPAESARPRAGPAAPALPADFEPASDDGAPAESQTAPALALVLDDVGFDLESLRRLATLEGPLSIAVIPNAPFAKDAARLAVSKRWDLLVHLPMAGAEGAPSEAGAIGPSDDDAEIGLRVARAIESVPGAIGLNNHQGSRATADLRVVRAVLDVVGQRGLFFLDSRTTPATVAEAEARRLGIPAVARDVFLDDAATEASAPSAPAALETAWGAALAKARAKGQCVLIGHPRKATLDFLERRLAGAPVRRVRVSELAD